MMIAMLALGLLQNVSADPVIDGPPLEWVTDRAPFGFDITPDSKLWINSNNVGAKDDFAILGTDLYKAITSHSMEPRVWVRGYHRRNPTARYRESKMLVRINCRWDTIAIEKRINYSAGGDVLDSIGPFRDEPIVPGSNGEAWRKMVCPAG